MIQNNRLSAKQATRMIVMFIIGSSSLLVMGFDAKKDLWIAFLLAAGATIIIMLIYARLLTVLPGRDFYDTLEHFLGKVGSKIALIPLIWFCIHNCSLALNLYGDFVITIGLPETPHVMVVSILIIVSALAVKYGIEVIARWNAIFVLVILIFLIISFMLAAKNMDISKILPVLDEGFSPIAKGALSVIGFPFADILIFLLVFPAFQKGTSVKKIFCKGLLIGGAFILLSSLGDILVLGTGVAQNKFFPTYSTMRTVNYGDFLQRLEVIAAIIYVIGVFAKITILLYGSCKGISKILGFNNHKFIVIPISFLIVTYTALPGLSPIYLNEWGIKVPPYYNPIFMLIIPLILLIIIEIKRRMKGQCAHDSK